MAEPLYRIVRSPDFDFITKDAEITYSCVGTRTKTMFSNGRQGPAESVRWYRRGERAIGWWDRRERDLGFGWDKVHKFESLDPGRYIIFAIVKGGMAGEGYAVGPVYQEVATDHTVEVWLTRDIKEAHKNQLADPNKALETIDKHIENLNKIAMDARYPLNKEQWEQHKKTVEKWQDHRSKVKARLASTDGRRSDRKPIYAVHIDYKTQARKQLNFFLVKMNVVNGREFWKLVDWTNPSERSQSSESDGDGMGTKEAIEDVFDEWDWWRGRYPPGKIKFEIPKEVCGKVIPKTLETDGKTTWDSLIGWLQIGAMAAAGVATLVAPIPGSRAASIAIWSTIFSTATGVASEVIAMGQRRAEGIYNAREDTYSALSIVGDLFTAGAARWLRGARVALKSDKGVKAGTYVFIGSVTGAAGTDVARGVLILEDKMKEYDEIMNDQTLLPEERAQRLQNVFRTLALNGAMIYIGVKGAKGDMTTIANKRGHSKLKGSTGIADDSADLRRLSKEGGEPIDTTKKQRTKGQADHPETRRTVTTQKRASTRDQEGPSGKVGRVVRTGEKLTNGIPIDDLKKGKILVLGLYGGDVRDIPLEQWIKRAGNSEAKLVTNYSNPLKARNFPENVQQKFRQLYEEPAAGFYQGAPELSVNTIKWVRKLEPDRKIFLDLNGVNVKEALTPGSANYNKVTSHELRYIKENWEEMSDAVVFYENGKKVSRPW